jgi:ATP-dependent Clp protease ATP-binding subunit ClpA
MRITTTAELLKAVELGIVDKTEARSLLGLSVKRGRWAKIQPRSGGRFLKVYPFNRFSDDAKQAMIRAQEVAASAGRAHIDPDDLLTAIAEQGAGTGAAILASLGISNEAVRSAVSDAQHGDVPVGETGPTAAMKSVIETAFHAVEYPGQIGTGHLLLALAGTPTSVLQQLGGSPEMISSRLSLREDLRT